MTAPTVVPPFAVDAALPPPGGAAAGRGGTSRAASSEAPDGASDDDPATSAAARAADAAPDVQPAAPQAAPAVAHEEPVGLPTMQRVALTGTFAFVAIAALWAGRTFLLPVLVAVLLSLLLSPAVGLLERLRVPRAIGALLVMVAALGSTGTLAVYLSAPVQQWLAAGPDQVDELRRKFRQLRQPVESLRGATDRVAEIAAEEPAKRPREVVIERRVSSSVLEHAQPIAIAVTSVLILLYFLLASGDLFLRKLIRVTPRLRDKIRAIEIARSVQQRIGRYFASITAINVGLGVVVTAAMAALGMPTPALLGAIAGLLNFVPYLGPLVALVVIGLVAIVTFDTVGWMLIPPAVFLAITTIEGQVVQPVVLGRQLSTTAVTMFLWVLFWGWLWGFGGVAVAVPLLVAVKIVAEHLPSWSPVAELLGRE